MSGRLSDRDLIAKLPDLSGEPLGYPSAIPFNEMVGAKLAVAHAVPEDVVGRCENRSGDRHHRLHRPASRPEAEKLRLRVRAFGACRAPCALDEDRLEPRGTLAQARGTAFASAFVHPRTEPRPRHQVLCRREAAHVDANFRNEHGGRRQDRKSTRLNSSHQIISYAVFCLKKKKKNQPASYTTQYPAH